LFSPGKARPFYWTQKKESLFPSRVKSMPFNFRRNYKLVSFWTQRERERVFFSAWIHSYGYDLGFPILSTKIRKLNLDMATDLPCLLPFLLFLFISHFPLSFSGHFFNNSLNFFITTTILCFQLLIFIFFRFSKFNGVSSWSNKVNVCGFWWIPLC